jgi:hypothetical protein
MSAPKPVLDGPRAGQMRIFCVKCGHIEFQLADGSPAPRGPQPQPGQK